MDGMSSGAPWLDQPIQLHSSRVDECELSPSQCAYRSGHWRYWYEADHVYALPTVYFCIAIVAVFAIGHCVSLFAPQLARQSSLWKRAIAVLRYTSYRGFAIKRFGWFSTPLGVMLLGIAGLVFFLSMVLGPKPYYWPDGTQIKYGNSPPLATRSGYMALALLPFVLASATKLNLITLVTGISHEKIQPLHRWGAWAMFVLALVHTFPFVVFNIRRGTMREEWDTSVTYWTGVVAIIPQAYLTFFSVKTIRDRFYEFFKSTHLMAALVFVVFFFLHCDFTLTTCDYFIAAGVVYFGPLFCLWVRIFCEHGFKYRASVSVQANGYINIRIPIPPHMTWTPGQHVFLRFLSPKLGLHTLTAHPFTICSLPNSEEAIFYVRVHEGITARLASLATAQSTVSILVLLDGPYGGLGSRSVADFGHSLIIAGGSGAGLTLPLIEDVLQQTWTPTVPDKPYECYWNISPVPRLDIVVATRDEASRSWYRLELENLLRRYSASGRIASPKVRLHMTGSSKPCINQSSVEQGCVVESVLPEQEHKSTEHKTAPLVDCMMCEGRPDLALIVKETVEASDDSVGIVVCGPASMLHDVRNAAADAQVRIVKGSDGVGPKEVFLHTEHFGW